MNTTKCKSCGADIVFIKTPSGKSIPCDAEAVVYIRTEEGKDRIVTGEGATLRCEIVIDRQCVNDEGTINGHELVRKQPYETGTGFIPHWSTCNAPDKFRKKETKK